MQGQISLLNQKGHTQTTWDTEKPETVEAARRVFARLMRQGCSAYAMEAAPVAGSPSGTLIREFDPEVATIVIHRPLVGG